MDEGTISTVSETMADYGLHAEQLPGGRDLLLRSKGSRSFYSPSLFSGDEDPEAEVAPVAVTPRRPRVAALYLCRSRHSGAANFSPRGYFGSEAPDLYLLWLEAEECMFQVNAGELREFERAAAIEESERLTRFERGEREANIGFWLPKGRRHPYPGEAEPRRNSIRVWFKVSSTDFLLENRTFDGRGRRVRRST